MTDEPDDFEVGIDGYGNLAIWIDGIPIPIDDAYDEVEDEPVEVDNRVRGVQWRDEYGDDQLRTSAQHDERPPQVATPTEPAGLGAALLRISRSLGRFVIGRRVGGSDR